MALVRYIASLCGNQKIYLPVPIFKFFSGGRAAGNNLPYEAFLILPTGMCKAYVIFSQITFSTHVENK
jgi:enolase